MCPDACLISPFLLRYFKFMLTVIPLQALDRTANSANAMESGIDAEWRAKFMRSAYTAANDDVVPAAPRHDATQEAAFFRWMQQQQTYYGDLLVGYFPSLTPLGPACPPEPPPGHPSSTGCSNSRPTMAFFW